MYCSNCGLELFVDANYCESCGTPAGRSLHTRGKRRTLKIAGAIAAVLTIIAIVMPWINVPALDNMDKLASVIGITSFPTDYEFNILTIGDYINEITSYAGNLTKVTSVFPALVPTAWAAFVAYLIVGCLRIIAIVWIIEGCVTMLFSRGINDVRLKLSLCGIALVSAVWIVLVLFFNSAMESQLMANYEATMTMIGVTFFPALTLVLALASAVILFISNRKMRAPKPATPQKKTP